MRAIIAVVFLSAPFQIVRSIILSVLILMVDNCVVIWIINKRFRDKAMNVKLSRFPAFAKVDK